MSNVIGLLILLGLLIVSSLGYPQTLHYNYEDVDYIYGPSIIAPPTNDISYDFEDFPQVDMPPLDAIEMSQPNSLYFSITSDAS